jgi:microcystin-dependent protein
MSEPFVGQITMFGGNFAPRGWAFCDGQLLSIAQFTALFSLLGTIYGGDGRTTFALPDMRGRLPVHAGQGPGLPNIPIGAKAGTEKVTLTASEMPSHTHALQADDDVGTTPNPANQLLAEFAQTFPVDPYSTEAPSTPMNANAIDRTGGGQAHDNVQPFLCVNFIIALQGIFPSRS